MKSFLPVYILLIAQTGLAQSKKVQLSISGGTTNASSKAKDNSIGNGYNFQADAFVPFYSKNNFTVGLNIGGNYSSVKNILPDNSNTAAKYKAYNTEVSVDGKTSKSHSNSISGFAGIQAQLGLGRFYLSPSFNAGYLNLEQEGFTQTGSASINGQQYQKELVKRDKQTISGLLLKPQLKAGYQLSNNLSVFASAAMVSGPETNQTTAYLVPNGGYKDNNMYEVSQLANGSYQNSVTTFRYNYTEVNIGLSLRIGKSKSSAKGSGAASASYAAGKLIQTGTGTDEQNPNQPAAKSISTKGVKRNEEAASARPGNPIGGIIVKGGKNPGGNLRLISDENGKIEFDVQEAGEYAFQLSAPEEPAGKSISEKGLKRTEAVAMAKPGQPIKGVIVRGGKKPGGNMMQIVTDGDGKIILSNLEPGNYQFILQAPENTPKQSKKKVKEHATSGMKDTLKTNV